VHGINIGDTCTNTLTTKPHTHGITNTFTVRLFHEVVWPHIWSAVGSLMTTDKSTAEPDSENFGKSVGTSQSYRQNSGGTQSFWPTAANAPVVHNLLQLAKWRKQLTVLLSSLAAAAELCRADGGAGEKMLWPRSNDFSGRPSPAAPLSTCGRCCLAADDVRDFCFTVSSAVFIAFWNIHNSTHAYVNGTESYP